MRDRWLKRAIKRVARVRSAADLKLTRMIQRRRIYRLGGACNRCGKCCRMPMVQVFPPFLYLKMARWWIITWHRRINGFEFIREDRKEKTFTFRCTHLDIRTGLCDAYESRPGMCRDYPRVLLDTTDPQLFDTCGYYPVLINGKKLSQALDGLDLPEAKREDLKRRLYLVD
ncbi:hypothetical protein D3OALGB2SA_5395 [Olavius algarvensis associated proteobacterium Delta 3]|nr:hypothetical protein D3OALGB2SA_5395 [Olavius algarvensis associated proteobacterium Delta 3]